MNKEEFIDILEKKMGKYEELLNQKERNGILSPNASHTYLYHSNNFLRWCKGEFIPGEKNEQKRNNKN
ncbi:MAG: hypothetical protein ABS960_00595 [Solibacillus isronensis]